MKNIHVLPTEKQSRLYYNGTSYKDPNSTMAMDWFISSAGYKPQNIYITSDEEIKEGDYYIKLQNRPYINRSGKTKFKGLYDNCQKIILTTDQDLDGVQAIDDEFLEWFIKNPRCEEVEVEKMFNVVQFTSREFIYKIIIPKEEAKQEIPQIGTKEFNDLASAYFGGKPKQYLEKEMFELEQELDIPSHLRWHNSKPKQETPEEVELAILFHNTYEKLAPSFGYETREDTKSFDITTPNGKLMIAVCKEIIKWQQERMYSEEEVLKILLAKNVDLGIIGKTSEVKEWFEQFKNK